MDHTLWRQSEAHLNPNWLDTRRDRPTISFKKRSKEKVFIVKEARVSYGRLKEINMNKINQIKKEIFTSMKMMDTTIKGIKESEEYKIAQAYNQGLRDAMAIFEREMKR